MRGGMRYKAVLLLGWALATIADSACGGTSQPAPTPDIEAKAQAMAKAMVVAMPDY